MRRDLREEELRPETEGDADGGLECRHGLVAARWVTPMNGLIASL